ncbi:hypothetical protein BC829DRAFT_391157 [Chytridium lagenaria]|nr:hypothetical protein BC829DRAFT_391157 [Chytridium lagenaria]
MSVSAQASQSSYTSKSPLVHTSPSESADTPTLDPVPPDVGGKRARSFEGDEDSDGRRDGLTEGPINEKRMRNTEAARRSRARKVAKMETLEEAVQKLETENSKLVVKLAVLESERAGWKAKQIEYLSRISRLEQQLSESHQAIIGRRGGATPPT